MARFLRHYYLTGQRMNRCVLLALCWCLGLVLGCLLFSRLDNSFLSLMRMAPCSSVSIVSLVSVTILPFLVSAFAVYCNHPQLLLAIAFGKGTVFSFVSLSVWMAFGSAGWLVQFLLMFSDVLCLPVLFRYWVRHISGEHPWNAAEAVTAICVAAGIGILDFCFVAPFLALIYT